MNDHSGDKEVSPGRESGTDDAELVRALVGSHDGGEIGSPKEAGVVFQSLSVTVPDGDAVYVKTLPRAIMNTFGVDQFNFLRGLLFSARAPASSTAKTKHILSDITGLVKPGEMLFVLGRPGSGCSTLLRTLANRSKLSVSGDLHYSGISSAQFSKTHSRETIYMPEEDRHIASLNVRQTIEFALRMALPNSMRSKGSVEELCVVIARMFGLEHALQTPVGGAFFPGVSGGERKRVSIAEILAAGSTVQCFDNSTRGLDSSTALDFVKALRTLTDVGQKTTMATLYQAGENIYTHFDKVLLLDSGHEVFFGRVDEASSYFESLGFLRLPGQTTAEYLTTVTDATERRAHPNSQASTIQTPLDLARAFKSSSNYHVLVKEIKEYEMHLQAAKPLDPSSSHNLPYHKQIFECLIREYLIVRGQLRVYQTKWVTTIILCLAIGSLYFDLQSNSQGAFSRGSILFFALIMNGWLQFPELFDAHTNRPVLERQAQLNMYRPSAVALARVLIDMPLIAFQHVLFILPFYFLTRLQVDAGKFFFFYLTLYISSLNFSNLLRLFAYYVPSLDDCFRYGGTACTIVILFSGFLIPASDMRPYFGWLHWIDPMYYAYENLLVNEFNGLLLDCSNSLVPDIPNAQVAYQSCSIRGAVPGSISVTGAQYTESLGFFFAHRWRNIGIMIAIVVVYVIVAVVGSEIMSFSSQGGTPIVYVSKRRQAKLARTIDAEKSAPTTTQNSNTADSEVKGTHQRHAGPTLTWNNLTVDIGEKQILKGISAFVRPGDFVALCGASGAGKTTLISALSQTNSAGQVGGEVLFGGKATGKAYKKAIGFAQQMDLHDGTATVREALEFSALLRQSSIYTKSEKLAYVDRVLDLLDLRKVENAMIGDEAHSLGVELAKRITIAVELVARPKILFADEPTSGLDSQSAASIVRYLKRLSQEGQAVLVTIHQPSASLFAHFDKLLALSSEGRQLYFGSVEAVIPYFGRHGAVCPPDTNPAEFVLETVGAGILARSNDSGDTWAANWAKSGEARTVQDEIRQLNGQETSLEDDGHDSQKGFNASTFVQVQQLTLRYLKAQWRNVPYMYSKIWVHVISAILVGFTFYNVGTSPRELQDRAFSVYFIVFLVNSIVNTILARFFFAGLYWQYREGPSQIYSWVSLCTSSVLAEMPGALVCAVVYFLLWYFPSGLPRGGVAGYIFLTVLTYEVFQVLLGLFMMALSPDLGFAGNVLVFLVCTMNWYNGIIVPYAQIQVFWRYWLYYLSPFTYLLGGMVTAVIQDQPVVCTAADLVTFSPPPGSTCGAYAASWANSAHALLNNPTDTANCTICPYTNGNQYLEGFHLGNGMVGGIWGYWGIFLAFTFSNLALFFFFTWATKVKHWKLFYFF